MWNDSGMKVLLHIYSFKSTYLLVFFCCCCKCYMCANRRHMQFVQLFRKQMTNISHVRIGTEVGSFLNPLFFKLELNPLYKKDVNKHC